MDATPSNACPNCERLRHHVQVLTEAVSSLTEQVRLLQEKLAAAGKNSTTSSKPPSSDIVKPPKPAPPPRQSKRSIGGQLGHPRHERAAFPPEQINGGVFPHILDCCPDCGHTVAPLDAPPRVVQQLDVQRPPLIVEEHRSHPAWCRRCAKMHYAPLPACVQAGGLVGPRLTRPP